VPVLGYIINKVPTDEVGRYRELLEPAHGPGEDGGDGGDGDGLRLLGIMPHEPALSRLPVWQVQEELNGKLIAGQSGLENTVGKVLVGAMSVESTIRSPLFHSTDKLIITGGDRIDMQLASLDTSTSGMVLTGGVYPDPRVIATADDRGVPLILVKPDTYTVTAQVERMRARVRPGDRDRLDLIRSLVKENVDLSGIV
jgi:BioD-like phosphotransacetylase family protein